MAKDLEFHVELADGTTKVCQTFDAAAGLATSLACCDGKEHSIDVVAWTRAAAVAYSGDDGGEQYDEDPDSSVFDRIVIRAESLGRVA